MDQPNVVLPKELRLAPPATMPQSRSYMFKQQAALSNYAPQDTIQINLPRLQRSYLTKDSYLEFEVTFTHTVPAANFAEATLALDTPGALGLINRIEVYDYLGSTQLESTSGFGQLVALLQDCCIPAEEYSTHQTITSGSQHATQVYDWERNSQKGAESTIVHYGTTRTLSPCIGEVVDQGAWVNDTNAVATASTTRKVTRRYHLPLFSFLGLLSPKYAPLHNGYTIMITLQSANNALVSAGTKYTLATNKITETDIVTSSSVSFTVNNARMCCQILELGPVAESMLLSTTGGQPMIVTTKAYRNYTTNIAEKSSSFRLDLNINVASLTNVLWIMRPTEFINAVALPSLSHRQRNFLESWYFQYGSSILPQTQGITAFKPISNTATDKDWGSEALCELLKARHMFNQPNQHHQFNKWNWAYDNYFRSAYLSQERFGAAADHVPKLLWDFKYATPDSVFEHGKFACGLDLELVSGRTNEIICGMNTNGMNTSIFATFNATAAAATVYSTAQSKTTAATATPGVFVSAHTVDAWCEYDAFINVSPGIATTVSF